MYRYDLDTGQLTDLTPVGDTPKSGLHRQRRRRLPRVLRGRGRAGGLAGEPNRRNGRSGQTNLYLDDDGATTFMRRMKRRGRSQRSVTHRTAPGSRSTRSSSLTGYDNTPRHAGPRSISTAARRTASLVRRAIRAAKRPATVRPRRGHRHHLSDSGQVFFDTPEALVPSDTNGQPDVYEYEEGEPYLISAGTSAANRRCWTRAKAAMTCSSSPRSSWCRRTRRGKERDLRRARGRRLPRTRPRRRLARLPTPAGAASTAAVDLRGAVEPDVLRCGQPRAAGETKPKAQAQVKAREVQEGLRQEEGQMCEEDPEESREVRPRQQKAGK